MTIESESHQIDVVDLTSSSTSSTPQPTVVNLTEAGSEPKDKIQLFLLLSPIRSPNKMQFKSEVRKIEFNPSGLPSEPADVIETPIVINPDWLNKTSMIAAMELLGRPMTLDELRKWTEIRA